MRLYLSSYRTGDRAGSLLALLGSGKRTAVVSNALDNISPTARAIYRDEVYDPHLELRALGLDTEELDLRRFFGAPDALAERLKSFGTEFVIEPYIRFKGQVGEQATMFLFDPCGNALEFKAFKDMSQLFAK